MKFIALAVLVGSASSLKMPVPRVRARAARAPVKPVAAIKDLPDAITTDDFSKSTRNVVGLQATAWGIVSLFPSKCAELMGGAPPSSVEALVSRFSAFALLSLGGNIRAGNDADATQTGFLLFASWTYLLRNAAGYSSNLFQAATVFNTIMAVSMARRRGGLYKTLTTVDTDDLSSVLPKSEDTNARNIIGIQAAFWGIMCMFKKSYLLNTIMGCTAVKGAVACSSLKLNLLGVHNLLLGGRMFSSKSDIDAANTGVIYFGSATILMFLAKRAGTIGGQYVTPILAWNLLMTLYCYRESS